MLAGVLPGPGVFSYSVLDNILMVSVYDFYLIVSIRSSSSSQVGKLTLQSSGNEAETNTGESMGHGKKSRR